MTVSRRTRLIHEEGEAARYFELPTVCVAPGSDALASVVPPHADPNDPPVLLAGPVLRRVDRRSIRVWLATSVNVSVELLVYASHDGFAGPRDQWTLLGNGTGSLLRLGERLYVGVIEAVTHSALPMGQILGYDLVFTAPTDGAFATEQRVPASAGDTPTGGLVMRSAVTYGHYPIPTFLRGRSGHALSLLHVSCRKHHGPNADALIDASHYIRDHATSTTTRPAAVLHTGDQIYADDVDVNLRPALSALSTFLLGWEERVPPDMHSSVSNCGERARMVRDMGLTVDQEAAHNHLLGFGEFASMYILSWSPVLWRHPVVSAARGGFSRETEATAARRLLANVANYMMWDDHEITDDWPMTQAQFDRVRAHAAGAWIIANGMSAAYLFQLQGNCANKPAITDALLRYLASGEHLPHPMNSRAFPGHAAVTREYAQAVMGVRSFGYTAPTTPPIVVLDTRTQRQLHPDVGGRDRANPPGLLRAAAIGNLATTLRSLSLPDGAPLLIVSPAPVLGLGSAEYMQERGEGDAISWERDAEAWSLDRGAFHDFLSALHGAATAGDRERPIVFFSGDVHYGFAAAGSFNVAGSTAGAVRLVQLTSSALRNEPGAGSRFTLAAGSAISDATRTVFYRSTSGAITTEASEHNRRVAELSYSFRSVADGILGGQHVFNSNNFGIVRITWTTEGEVTIRQTLRGPSTTGPETEISLPVIDTAARTSMRGAH